MLLLISSLNGNLIVTLAIQRGKRMKIHGATPTLLNAYTDFQFNYCILKSKRCLSQREKKNAI